MYTGGRGVTVSNLNRTADTALHSTGGKFSFLSMYKTASEIKFEDIFRNILDS